MARSIRREMRPANYLAFYAEHLHMVEVDSNLSPQLGAKVVGRRKESRKTTDWAEKITASLGDLINVGQASAPTQIPRRDRR